MLQFARCCPAVHFPSTFGINTTVASVVLGVTSFGVACYAFIVVVGAASVSCPYQTPGAKFLRCLLSPTTINSRFIGLFIKWWDNLMGLEYRSLLGLTLLPPVFLVVDTYHLAQATLRVSVAVTRRVSSLIRGTHRWDQRTAISDPQRATRMFQISLATC